MNATIDLERPTIFPAHVLAGVTLRNEHLFPPTGLSLLKAEILSETEVNHHRQTVANAIGVPIEALKFQKQVHEHRVRIISAESGVEDSDGMVTQTQGLVLCAGMADCVGILLYDPEHEAVGALHSGWLGTKANIIAEGLRVMQATFGSNPAQTLAYIAPCASGERYAVRWDVAQYFPPSVLRQVAADQWLLDIRKRIVEQLTEQGVKADNIEVSSGCTIADERYHSHRRDGVRAGRMVAFIGLPK